MVFAFKNIYNSCGFSCAAIFQNHDVGVLLIFRPQSDLPYNVNWTETKLYKLHIYMYSSDLHIFCEYFPTNYAIK